MVLKVQEEIKKNKEGEGIFTSHHYAK